MLLAGAASLCNYAGVFAPSTSLRQVAAGAAQGFVRYDAALRGGRREDEDILLCAFLSDVNGPCGVRNYYAFLRISLMKSFDKLVPDEILVKVFLSHECDSELYA